MKKKTKTEAIIMRILAIIIFVLGLLLLIATPIVGIIALVFAVLLFVYSLYLAKKTVPAPDNTLDNASDNAPDVRLPSMLDGAPLAYHYEKVPIVTTEQTEAGALSMAAEHRWELTPKIDGDKVKLFFDDFCMGIMDQRADMMIDWIKRGDPYKIILQNYNTETLSCVVYLAFYRDHFKGQQWREQSIVTLTGYKSKAKQETISFLSAGDELELDEDYDHEGSVVVLYRGDEIGKLPGKMASKYLAEGCFGARIEQVDEELNDNADYVYTPIVRIFWNNKDTNSK